MLMVSKYFSRLVSSVAEFWAEHDWRQERIKEYVCTLQYGEMKRSPRNCPRH